MALFQQGSFIFDANTSSPQELARKRALIAQIMGAEPAVAPRNTWDGVGNMFASIAGGFAARKLNQQANETEQAGMAQARGVRDQLIATLTGGEFPPAPVNPGETTSMATMPAPDTASARVAQAHGDSTAPAGNLTESKQAFINALMPAAMQESQRTGIDPRIIVAQAAQETGWGRSAPGNNYFGIKSHGQGGGQTFATHEYVNGKRVNVRDSFRRFDSPADSVRGYGDFILNNPRYRPFMAAQGLDAQLEALQASGYATDPNYSRSVGAIARGIPLDSPVAANEAMAAGELSNGLTSDALQQWAFANYAQPQQPGGAIDAVNALGNAQPVSVAENEADILAQEAAMMGQDPVAFQQPGAVPPMPPARMVDDMPVAGTPPASPISARNINPDMPMAGAVGNRTPPPGPSLQQLLRVVSTPFIDEGTKAYANALLQQQLQAQDPYRQAQIAQLQAQTERLQRQAQGGDTRFGLNPIYGQDAEGNTVLGVLGDDGSFKPVDTGGVNISTGVDRVDLGTHYGLLDKRSGQMVGTLPKENYQEAFDTARGGAEGKAQGEAAVNLPTDLATSEQALSELDALIAHPGLSAIAGPFDQYRPSWMMGAEGRDALARFNQAKGRAFLQAFGMLKGGGQITEIEGLKAEQAMARMDRAQGEEEFKQALQDFRDAVATGMDKMRQRAGQQPASGSDWQDVGGVRIRRKQ